MVGIRAIRCVQPAKVLNLGDRRDRAGSRLATISRTELGFHGGEGRRGLCWLVRSRRRRRLCQFRLVGQEAPVTLGLVGRSRSRISLCMTGEGIVGPWTLEMRIAKDLATKKRARPIGLV